jgi:hypothetical protein
MRHAASLDHVFHRGLLIQSAAYGIRRAEFPAEEAGQIAVKEELHFEHQTEDSASRFAWDKHWMSG